MGAWGEKAKESIPFIEGYAAVNFNGEIIDSFGEEMEKVIPNIKTVVKEYLEIYKKLGEYSAGMPKEILMSTSDKFLLIRIFYNSERFQAVLLSSNGNLGYTRYILHQLNAEMGE